MARKAKRKYTRSKRNMNKSFPALFISTSPTPASAPQSNKRIDSMSGCLDALLTRIRYANEKLTILNDCLLGPFPEQTSNSKEGQLYSIENYLRALDEETNRDQISELI